MGTADRDDFFGAMAGAGLPGPTVGVHFAVGYTGPLRPAPAVAGACPYAAGVALTPRSTPLEAVRPSARPAALLGLTVGEGHR